MDLDQARDIIRTQHRAVLAATRSDGTPQMSPVLAAVDEQGYVLVSTRETAYKTRQLRNDPRVWLCVLPDEFYGTWIQVDGTAEVVDAVDDVEPFVEYFRNISGEHPDWDEYRAAMVAQGKSLLRVTPTRWGPDRTG